MAFRPINPCYLGLQILKRSVFNSCLSTIFLACRLERLERLERRLRTGSQPTIESPQPFRRKTRLKARIQPQALYFPAQAAIKYIAQKTRGQNRKHGHPPADKPYCKVFFSAAGIGKGMTSMPSSSNSTASRGLAWPRMLRASMSP